MELGFRLSFLWVVNIILVVQLVQALLHSECAAIVAVVETLQKMGRCYTFVPSKKIPLRRIGLLEVIRQRNNFLFTCLCLKVQTFKVQVYVLLILISPFKIFRSN